jgi:hypothetical protein
VPAHRSRLDLVAVALLLGGSAAVRLRALDRPLLGDELITFSNMVLGRSFYNILFGPFDSNNHVLNSIIMKIVSLGFGERPALMRLPNLVMTAAAIVLLYLVASRRLDRPSGFAAALLLAFHPAMVLYSVSCRGYAGMVLFTLVSSVLLLGLLDDWSWSRCVACALTGVIACGFHLFAVNVLIAQLLLVALAAVRPSSGRSPDPGRAALAPSAALAVSAAISWPSLSALGGFEGQFRFQAAFPMALVNFLGGHGYRTGIDIPTVLLVLVAGVGSLGLGRRRQLRRFAGLLFLSPAALYALSFVAPVFTLHPRFFCFLLPWFGLLVAAGLRLAVRWVDTVTVAGSPVRWLIRGVAAAVVLLAALTFTDRVRIPRNDWLARARAEVENFMDATPGAVILTNDPGFVRVRLRQQANVHRILPAPGVRAIRAELAKRPTGAAYFVYVPRKRLTAEDLIHYKGEVDPEVLYRRDDWLRGYLERNAVLEVDLGPRVFIYALRHEVGSHERNRDPKHEQANPEGSAVADRDH